MGNIVVMSRADYDKLDRVNFSTLKWVDRSPAHYRSALLEGTFDSDDRAEGRATHLATFEPEVFRREVVAYEGVRRGKDWDAFQRDNRQSIILKTERYERSKLVAEAARAAAGPLLSKGRRELTLLWDHPDLGIPMKGRIDFLTDGDEWIVDLKTCADASPRVFGAAAARMGYHIQAGIYVGGVFATTGKRPGYKLVAVEKRPPRASVVYTLTPEQLELGADRAAELLAKVQNCRSSNHWPSYEDQQLRLPKWAYPNPESEGVEGLGLIFGDEEKGED